MKKLMTFLCALLCALALTACGGSEEVTEAVVDSATLEQTVEGLYTSICSMTAEEIDGIINAKNEEVSTDTEQALIIKRGLTSYRDVQNDLGALVSIDDFEMTQDRDTITGTLHLTYEQRKADFIVIFNEDVTAFEAIKMQPEYTLGEKMGNAGLNTLMGMGIVFLVLIFIAILISLFKYIGKAEKYLAERKKRKKQTLEIPQVAQSAPVQEVIETAEEIDDLELIAVITAAIAASMNTSVDNLVVRSIRKRKSGR